MKKRIMPFLLCVVMITMLFPITAKADMGPKPSVRISFEGMGDALCYGTLLSETESTGPASVWDGKSSDNRWENGDGGYDIWKAFVEYEDADGYYFLQEWWECSGTKQLNWTYYPPSSFKILLYYPETETFVISGIYERYAFDSYFTVHMEGMEIDSVNNAPVLVAEKSYDYTWEMISLLCRIVITILLEIGIAWLFGFRGKKLILLITGINTATQIVLNVMLNVINYNQGQMAFVFFYVILELLVFLIEMVLYRGLFPKVTKEKISTAKIVGYTFTANAVSFIAGFAIAKAIPGIF